MTLCGGQLISLAVGLRILTIQLMTSAGIDDWDLCQYRIIYVPVPKMINTSTFVSVPVSLPILSHQHEVHFLLQIVHFLWENSQSVTLSHEEDTLSCINNPVNDG